ncbi:MAG: type II toxin-antitoxin system YhaV family toxin, partial [Rhodanobacter sp.]
GRKNKHWRRVKKGMPNRYRLFFQFQSTAPRSITYAWFNNEATLRKAGAKTDCYAVFCAHVAAGRVPSSYQDLKDGATELPYKFQIPRPAEP